MNTKLSKLERYRELELISEDILPKSRSSAVAQLKTHLGRWLSALFTHNQEPRIRRELGADGQLLWHVYDPLTGEAARFADEAAVRIWLEERHRARARRAPRHSSLPPTHHIWR